MPKSRVLLRKRGEGREVGVPRLRKLKLHRASPSLMFKRAPPSLILPRLPSLMAKGNPLPLWLVAIQLSLRHRAVNGDGHGKRKPQPERLPRLPKHKMVNLPRALSQDKSPSRRT